MNNILSLPKILPLVLVLTLSLLGLYLFQMGKVVRASYLIKTQKIELEKISKENLLLEEQAANLLSLENVEEKIKGMNFVEVSEVKYIPISSDYLVREIE